MHPSKTDADRLTDANEIIRKLLADKRELERDNRNLQNAADVAQEDVELHYRLAAYDPTPPTWLSGKGGRIGSRGCPITVWSDGHHGEVVNPSGVNGANKFNRKIAHNRYFRLFDTTVDLCYNHMGRAKTEYPGIIVCLGGDMVGGDNHEELARTNDLTPIDAVEDITDVLCAGLEKMASKFGRVYVPAVVGNHGRNVKKPPFKNITSFNYDYALYCKLRQWARDTKQEKFIHIDAPKAADIHFNSYGVRYMLTHGDNLGVKGGDGIIGAIGPILRGSIKLGHQTHQLGLDFDHLIMGHWHRLLFLPGVTVNNTLKGYDEYSALKLRAPPTTPSQALWFSHPEHGITARWEIFLEGKIKEVVGNTKQWITWQENVQSKT